MNTYRIYDHHIQSEIPLINPVDTADPVDISIHYGNILDAHNNLPKSQILQEKSGSARYLIQNGNHITIEATPEADINIIKANVLGGVLAVALQQRGLFVLHASCIVIEDQAVGFIGGSGFGKSTLAGYFGSKGHPVITDDILALDLKPDPLLALPSYPRIKLSAESLKMLQLSEQSLTPIHRGSSKFFLPLKQEFWPTPCPLKYLYLLQDSSKLSIQRLSTQEAFKSMMGFSKLIPSTSNREHIQQMEQCVQLLRQVRVSKILRPRSLPALKSILTAVLADVSRQDTE